MKKKEKTVCQIIRFRGNIDTFLVSIEKFARFDMQRGSILLEWYSSQIKLIFKKFHNSNEQEAQKECQKGV